MNLLTPVGLRGELRTRIGHFAYSPTSHPSITIRRRKQILKLVIRGSIIPKEFVIEYFEYTEAQTGISRCSCLQVSDTDLRTR